MPVPAQRSYARVAFSRKTHLHCRYRTAHGLWNADASIAIMRIDARIRAARPNSVGRGQRSCPSVEKFMGDALRTSPALRRNRWQANPR